MIYIRFNFEFIVLLVCVWGSFTCEMDRCVVENRHFNNLFSYSPIHLKIIEYRFLSSNENFKLPDCGYRRIKELGLLRVRKRGKRGGRSRFSLGRYNQNTGRCTNLLDQNRTLQRNNNSEISCIETLLTDHKLRNKYERSGYMNNFRKRGANFNNLIEIKPIKIDASQYKQISIGLVNTQSIRNKTDLVKETIIDSNTDIFILTETWLRPADDFLRVSATPDSFTFLDIVREGERAGGGTGLICRQEFKPKKVNPIIPQCNSFEHSVYNLSTFNNDLLIVAIYRPPNSTSFNEFIADFSSLLTVIISSPKKLLILGDFNVHINKPHNPDSSKFIDLLDEFGLHNFINIPTHTLGNTLDLAISRGFDDISLLDLIQYSVVSDHFYMVLKFNMKKPDCNNKTITFRNLKSLDIDKLKNDLHISFSEPADALTIDIDQLASNFDRIVTRCIDSHAPVITKTIHVKQFSPWFNSNLLKLKQNKRKLERKYISTKFHTDLDNYKRSKKSYIYECKTSKTQYFCGKFSECGNDQRKIYSLINSLTNDNSSQLIPNEVDDRVSAEKFSEHFYSKINTIINNIEEIVRDESIVDDIDPPSQNHSSFILNSFNHVTPEEVRSIIIKSPNKSCSLDPLPTRILKQCLDVLIHPITKIINTSFDTGLFPSSWKSGIITPVLKKGKCNSDYNSFRPITNTPFIAKILEKAVLNQLVPYLQTTNRYANNNSAYTENMSTETLLSKIHSDIMNSFDNQSLTLIVLLDLSAAFDTVNHSKIVNILQSRFNITDEPLALLSSYLKDRSQKVSINKILSSQTFLHHGVPQGSCIGPIAYLIYTSAISDIITRYNINIMSYADDTQLYISTKPDIASINQTIITINKCIHEIRHFFLCHQLKINDNKTEFAILGNRQQLRKIYNNDIYITVGLNRIYPSDTVRNLGFHFDSEMNLSCNINNVCKKSYFQLHKLHQIKYYLSPKILESLVHAFITSNLDYCNSLYINLPKKAINKLQKIQNSAARLITGSSKYCHITPILQQLHWLPVSKRVKFKVLTTVFKCLNNMAPKYLSDNIKIYIPTRNLRSINQYKLIEPPTTNNYGKRSFFYAGPFLWNQLPLTIRKLTSYSLFKKELKTHIFNQ